MDRTLLYIDPDPATHLLVRTVLATEGFLVLEARSAAEAQQSAARIRPDLVLVDVDLVKAAEVVPALRQTPGLEQVRFLASTACAGTGHLEKMLAWGFDRVLLKPFDIDTLARELTSSLPAPVGAKGAAEAEAPPEVSSTSPSPEPVASDDGVQSERGTDEMGSAVAETSREETAAPGESPVEAEEETASAGPGESPVETEVPLRSLDPVEVSSLWRLALTPGTAHLVASTASASGLLALLDNEERAFVIVAAASSRRRDDGDAGARIGARIHTAAAPWVHPVMRDREAAVLAIDAIVPSPLVPPGSHTVLIVPVASGERTYGVAILGKSRAARAPAFSPAHVAKSLAQATRMAGLVQTVSELDRAMTRKRREMEDLRIETVRGLLAEAMARAKPARRGGTSRERSAFDYGHAAGGERDRVIRLGLALAEELGLSARRQELLRQALAVHDIGTAWVEQVLSTRATFSAAGRERLPDAHAEHGAAILSALDWPATVVELVRIHQAQWNGDGYPAGLSGADIPLEARVMAVVSTFAKLTAGRTGEDGTAAEQEALAELSRQAGHRFDPDVVQAFIGLGPSGQEPFAGPDDHERA